MDLVLKNKINVALQHPRSLEIISENDFYFQKAKDALQDFLQFVVSKETKAFLLANRKEYNELKQLFEDSLDLAVFGKLLFTVIAYCDTNAHKKRELNLYDDKRVLALAFVRMNHWVEQLITYKFEGHFSEGSVKNAIEYLLNPIDNFTMLSENHRSQISQNLFDKTYDKVTFKKDFSNFFSKFSITVKKPENYTHLLTRLAYDNQSDWKDFIIGLICPDNTGWQESAINDTKNGNHIALWNHKKPNGTLNSLKLLRQCIEENGFFRIFYTASHKVNYVAEVIDFVGNQDELTKIKWPVNYGEIEWYDDDFSKYIDGSKTASWIYLVRKIEKVNPNDYLDFQYYKSFGYPSVGCQAPVISYKNSFEIKYKNQMNQNINLLKYKKQIILQGPPGTGKTREAKLIAKEIIKLNTTVNKTIAVKALTKDLIKSNLSINQKIEGKNKTLFEVVSLEDNVVIMKSDVSKPWRPSYNKIIESFNGKLWAVKNRTGGYKPYEDAIAKYFYENHFDSIKEVEENLFDEKDFLCLIQFHPSYTYEDFVRGIVAKPNEESEGILYIGENKTLGKFAENALNDSNNNYIIIIDEINRANLSSVLGELIYALEYRGEAVESMYEVEGDNKLILPPNLYIIGTMNTADRSVGHIDYAIRRRFAFVHIEPKNLKEAEGLDSFDDILFNNVADLFETNLSSEFEKKDVQLGHSYFIDKSDEEDGAPMTIRLEYEIKPILLEYVKDGVLIGDDIKQKINDLKTSI